MEIPGRGRLASQPAHGQVQDLAAYLAHTLPLDELPYVLFGTCLGSIVAYELAALLEREEGRRLPLALIVAAVAPPHLYARAVMRLYLQRAMSEMREWVGLRFRGSHRLGKKAFAKDAQ